MTEQVSQYVAAETSPGTVRITGGSEQGSLIATDSRSVNGSGDSATPLIETIVPIVLPLPQIIHMIQKAKVAMMKEQRNSQELRFARSILEYLKELQQVHTVILKGGYYRGYTLPNCETPSISKTKRRSAHYRTK